MDQTSADILLAIDRENQQLCRTLEKAHPHLDLSLVLSIQPRLIRQYADSIKNSATFLSTFQTNKGYAGLVAPSAPAPSEANDDVPLRGPDISSRCFGEDVPYGLCVLKTFAELAHVDTPMIDTCLRWHQTLMGVTYIDDSNALIIDALHDSGSPYRYGYSDLSALLKKYAE